MRIDGVLLISGFALAGSLLAGAPLAVGCALMCVCALLWQSTNKFVLLVGVALCAGFALRATSELVQFERQRIAARDALAAPDRCEVNGRVAVSPTQSAGQMQVIVDVGHGSCGDRALAKGVRVRLRGASSDVVRGDEISALADLGAVEIYRNAGARNPIPVAARSGVLLSGTALSFEIVGRVRGLRAAVDGFRNRVRSRISRTYAPKAEALGRALVLGENDLSDDDDTAFKHSGLSHLLAVSGTHLVFAVVALVQALRFLLVRVELIAARGNVERWAAFLGSVLALAYADFAGGSGSAWRAAWMLCAAFLVQALGYRPKLARSLGFSILVGCACDPLCGFDVSFLLSVAATCGLLCISQPLAEHAKKLELRAVRYVALSLCATLGAMLGCAPLLSLLGSELTLASMFANVIAGPLGEAVSLPLCLVHAVASSWKPLEHGLALCASGALLVVRAIAHTSARWDLIALKLPDPDVWQLASLSVGVLGLLLCETRRLRMVWLIAVSCGIFALELQIRRVGAPVSQLRMTAVDVGQGDSTLIDFPDGRSMLIDAGGSMQGADPGERAVVPLLRARRRTKLDVVVLSHPHPDHFGGLLSVIKAVEVGEFWDSGQGKAEGAGPRYAELLRELERRHIPIRHPHELCKRPRKFGGAVVETLAPCPRFTPDRDANDNSVVLRLQFGARRVLLVGDAEAVEERELIAASSADLRADVLKVGHHGSRTSSSAEFLNYVKPRIGTIACGVRNRFGHPHQSVLERFLVSGVAALRLDRVGSVVYQTDGSNQELFTFSSPR